MSVKNNEFKLKQVTIDMYERQLKCLNDKNIKYDDLNKSLEIINDLKILNVSDETIVNYICAIIYYHKNNNNYNDDNSKIFLNYFRELRQINNKLIINHELINNQKQNYMPWDEIKKIDNIYDYEYVKERKEYDKNKNSYNKKDYTRKHNYLCKLMLHRLILSLYVKTCPRRLKDYSLLYIITNENKKLPIDKNYYIVSNELFIFNEYKTKDTYSQQKIKSTPLLSSIINDYIKFNKIKNNQSLLNMSVSQICDHLNNIFSPSKSILKSKIKLNLEENIPEPKVSANIIRHSFISHCAILYFFSELEARKILSKCMGNSIIVQEQYRKDIPKITIENDNMVYNTDIIIPIVQANKDNSNIFILKDKDNIYYPHIFME